MSTKCIQLVKDSKSYVKCDGGLWQEENKNAIFVRNSVDLEQLNPLIVISVIESVIGPFTYHMEGWWDMGTEKEEGCISE